MPDVSPSSIQGLVDDLAAAQQRYLADARDGAISTIQSLISFCERNPALHQGLTPLVGTLAALDGLDEGVVSSITRPTKISHRPPDLKIRDALRAVSISCMEALHRYGYSVSDASRMVAREMAVHDVRIGGHCGSNEAEVVRRWFEGRNRRKSDQLDNTLSEFRKLLALRQYRSKEEAWSDIRGQFCSLLLGLRPSLK